MIKATLKNPAFLNFFYHDAVDIDIEECGTRLNLFIPKIESNRFAYEELSELLEEALSTYALSRKTYAGFIDDNKHSRMVKTAISRLKNYLDNTGELGELFLYCFLESHLKAPKIITKLEIKTSTEHYVYGSDGIHLFQAEDSRYKLIFGESKLMPNLTTAITEAFNSISDILSREKNNIQDELFLVTSNLEKETFSKSELDSLLSILKPSAVGNIKTDKAFAIFVGYETTIKAVEMSLANGDFEQLIRKRILDEVATKYEHIKNKIKDKNLLGYNFYIYPFPFTELSKTRAEIIKQLTRIDS